MTKLQLAHAWAKLILVSSFAFVGISLGVLLVRTSGTLGKVDATITHLNQEITAVDTTRKSLDDLMIKTTTLIIDADTAADKETKTLDNINAGVTGALKTLNQTFKNIDTSQQALAAHTLLTLDATTKVVAGIQPVLDATTVTLGAATDTVHDVHKLVNDPAIPATLVTVQETSANVAVTTKHVADVSKDVADATHNLLHPAKKVGFWATSNAVIMYLKQFIPSIAF